MNRLYEELEDRLGLHVALRVIYVVDGYEASLVGDNEEPLVTGIVRDTLAGALNSLEDAIRKEKK